MRAGSETAAPALFLLPGALLVRLRLRSAVPSHGKASPPRPGARLSDGDKCREVCAAQGFGFPAEEGARPLSQCPEWESTFTFPREPLFRGGCKDSLVVVWGRCERVVLAAASSRGACFGGQSPSTVLGAR